MPSGEVAPLYDVATRYADEGIPLVIIGGKEYGQDLVATGRQRHCLAWHQSRNC